MPRAPRIEYAGAVYHVMCRGDRRERIIREDEDARLFLHTLEEACARTGWQVQAYVLMPNHYHLLLETPAANLVAGMRWLQSTYTLRFNARHRECGHLFQGRYKALVVDGAEPEYLRVVSDYIHLNPARAKLLDTERPNLAGYPWSSYGAYVGLMEPPVWLRMERVLESHGWAADHAGQRGYATYLAGRVAEGRAAHLGPSREFTAVRRGWCLGDGAFRQRLLDRLAGVVAAKQRASYAGASMQAYDEQAAERLLAQGLRIVPWTQEELHRARPSDARKQGLAWLLRTNTTVGCGWITAHLRMGHPSNISRAMHAFVAPTTAAYLSLKSKLLKCKD